MTKVHMGFQPGRLPCPLGLGLGPGRRVGSVLCGVDPLAPRVAKHSRAGLTGSGRCPALRVGALERQPSIRTVESGAFGS